ncbi:MAG: AbiH family protein [Coriobacteriia bacterium]|nr:AbiH family protein [Coriobacteriia bacterium]
MIAGNGFDLSSGLDTSVHSFLKCLQKSIQNESSRFPSFVRNSIMKTPDRWFCLEEKIGQVACYFSNASEYLSFYEYLKDEFINFISLQENKIQTYRTNFLKAEEFCTELHNIFTSFTNIDSGEIQKLPKSDNFQRCDWDINFVTFNYTSLLDELVFVYNEPEKIYRFQKESHKVFGKYERIFNKDVLHIHGSLRNDDKNIIFGLDNKNQINNPVLRENRDVQHSLLKTIINENNGLNRIPKFYSLINNADIILMYGWSLGSTDKFWVDKVKEWILQDLDNNDKFIVVVKYFKDKITEIDYEERKSSIDATKNIILDGLDLSVSDMKKADNKIHVLLNTANDDLNLLSAFKHIRLAIDGKPHDR